MSVAIITGAGGLVGSASINYFSEFFDLVVGIDNDMRSYFFGNNASTEKVMTTHAEKIPNSVWYDTDIREQSDLEGIFKKYNTDIELIVHCAAQPSHDWAAKEPITDFTINANGTLNLLECTRKFCSEAVFIHCSTNKVYGDTPNNLPLIELETRLEIEKNHRFHQKGINEEMSIDNSLHSIFGASKLSADLLAQEYGKYFGLKTGIFRGGCLTGSNHQGAKLHGFLNYLFRCAIFGDQYTIIGYQGKQVRDNIHAEDLVRMFYEFFKKPCYGEVFNVGGSRYSNCSVIEAIGLAEEFTGKKMIVSYLDDNRIGDHKWYISDISKFQSFYPDWKFRYNLKDICEEIFTTIR